eukprot:CAMPEP_0178404514 /NCGR_PEP_ID=MMETSP0689_2-20121128/17925_1 /TAXON_ID=160604 /ORGANISM="Amphidinium massartii, Strain CS-259" /LENGTH=139 /DNA_ID=CAMNT_0020025505 /DNA_START=128 /DNA_END=547 /DNA_ORIENTATION=+
MVLLLGANLEQVRGFDQNAGWGKITHQVEKLNKVPCAKEDRVRRGQFITVLLSADGLATDLQTGEETEKKSGGIAVKDFIVGEHNVPAINKAAVGMCPGESRRVNVFFGSHSAMSYYMELKQIHADDEDDEAAPSSDSL